MEDTNYLISKNSHRWWPAPAKLNLFLRVLERRADGYHNIQTWFQFINLHDELRFDVCSDGGIVRSQGPAEIPPSQDLCMRAAWLLKKYSNTAAGVRIAVRKNIPLGAGLGGGSSCAATTLLALNHLWQLGMTRTKLARLAIQLGADVPVFVHGQAALAESIGEQLHPCVAPLHWYALLIPHVHVSTARVYAEASLHRRTARLCLDALAEDARARLAVAGNDLQDVTCRLYPQVASSLQWLRRRVGCAQMSGSGGAVFAVMQTRAHAMRIVAQAPCAGFVVRGVNRHPLAGMPTATLEGARDAMP